MTYTRYGDEIILQMKSDDYYVLNFLLTTALDAVRSQDKTPARFYRFLRFVYELNLGNPDWLPYVVPAQPEADSKTASR